MKKQTFLQGAFVLMIANLVNRVLGFLLRIILFRLIGDEGLGLFQMVYPFFTTLLLICTMGFPVAIAKLIPEELAINNQKGANDYLKVTLIFTGFLGISTTIILIFSANLIAENIFTDKRTYYILLAIAPALIFSPLAAGLRGFFQGFQSMTPTAISQIIEQINRFFATLILLTMFSYLELKYRAASIALGISIGEFSGLLILIYLLITHLNSAEFISNTKSFKEEKSNLKKEETFSTIFKNIIRLAVPITIGKLVNSLMWSAEAILIPRQLRLSGIDSKEATSLFGQLSGMVEPIVFLPTVITIALTTSLVPTVSDSLARNNFTKIKKNYQDVIRISTYIGFPITVIFFSRGKEICQLLYDFPEAGSLLAVFGFSATFIYYFHVSTGMLNGLGKPQLALINLSIGSIIKLIGIYYLTRQPVWGIYGAAVSITLNYVIACLLNFLIIGNLIGYRLNLNQTLLKPFLSSSILFFINPYLEKQISLISTDLNYRIQIIFLLICMILVYLGIMVAIRAITLTDISEFRNKK